MLKPENYVEMKKTFIKSRGVDVNMEKCISNIGNVYDTILVAAHRARELAAEYRKEKYVLGETLKKPIVSALLDIQSGTVGKEYLGNIRSLVEFNKAR